MLWEASVRERTVGTSVKMGLDLTAVGGHFSEAGQNRE